jgi:hypothetical protein
MDKLVKWGPKPPEFLSVQNTPSDKTAISFKGFQGSTKFIIKPLITSLP